MTVENPKDTDLINIRIAKAHNYAEISESVSELQEQILSKSKIPDTIADKMLNAEGCFRVLGKFIVPDEVKLSMVRHLDGDDFVGYARQYYPPVAIGRSYHEKVAVGEYIFGASLYKHAEKKIEEIRHNLESTCTINNNKKSLKLESQYDYYTTLKEIALGLFRDVVVEISFNNFVHGVEGHFNKF